MLTEPDIQRQLVQVIWGAGQGLPPGLQGVGTHALASGLNAYREHAKALAVRALGAAYPLLQEALGAADFAGLAWSFARAHPPQAGDVAQWGAALPSYLRTLPGMEAEPPALAELDWTLHALGSAADVNDDASWVAELQAGLSPSLRLSPHVRVLDLPQSLELPAPVAWGGGWGPERGERRVLVWRRGWRPLWAWVPRVWADTLLALGQGLALEEALAQTEPAWALLIESAKSAEAAADAELGPGAWLVHAVREGWILGPSIAQV